MKPPFSTDLRFRFGSARRAAARWGAAAALAVGALFLGACASRPDLVWTEDGRQFGKASWYDDHGDRTANGERFNMHALTAAHPSLALNSLVEVTNLRNLSESTDGYYSYVPDSGKLADWFKKLGQIINNVQVIEFSVAKDTNHPGSIELAIDEGGQKLTRTRTWK